MASENVQRYIEEDLTQDLTYHGGDLIIEGDVAPGVQINVTNGSVIVDGSVGAGATITQNSPDPKAYGIEITRSVDEKVVLEASDSISVAETLANGSKAKSTRGDIIVATLADGCALEAKGNATVSQNIVGTVKITAENIYIEGSVGPCSQLRAVGNIEATGEYKFGVKATAGKSIICGNVAEGCKLTAQTGDIEAGYVSSKATLCATSGQVHKAGQSEGIGYAR